MANMQLLIALSILCTSTCILLQLTPQTETKCFLSQVSPDKTLETKFGILRTTKDECVVGLTIAIIDDKDEPRQMIYDKQHSCYQTKSNDPIVIKHTSSHLEYDGKYQICVQAIDIRTPVLLVELFMGERLNPALYHNQLGQLPLVESTELLQLQQKVQVIKRILVKLEGKTEHSRKQGQSFDTHIEDILGGSKLIAIIHIILVIVFGAVWVYLVKQLKRNH